MTAHVIADVDVTDPEGYQEYARLAGASIRAYGGALIVRAITEGQRETLEGDWAPDHLVIAAFESVTRAKEWYTSPEYEEAKRVRRGKATMRQIMVEGT